MKFNKGDEVKLPGSTTEGIIIDINSPEPPSLTIDLFPILVEFRTGNLFKEGGSVVPAKGVRVWCRENDLSLVKRRTLVYRRKE